MAFQRRISPAVIAAALALAWLALAPRTPDLAAQVYRVLLFARDGFQVYDDSWYGGFHLPGYSLTFFPLATAAGPRVIAAVGAAVSTVLFERLAVGWWGPAGRPAAYWFALAALANLVIGRLTFSLGMGVGIASLLALQRGKPVLAAAIAAVCAATSPVAAAFLALAATAVWLAFPHKRSALGIPAAATAVVIVLSFIFPDNGSEPTSTETLVAVLGVSALVAVVAGRRERAIQIGCGLYALAGIATAVLQTPMGGNISRLGAELAAPLLAGALAAARPKAAWKASVPLAAVLAVLVGWQWHAPVREVIKGWSDPSFTADYYTPLIGALDQRTQGPTRIEVPFTRGHWESVYLAQRYPLARGWETQLDVKYDDLFYESGLSAARYHDWLMRNAVSYVALPDVALDPTGRAEAQLIRSQPPYLRPVWANAHWTLYAVEQAQPVSGPGRLVMLGPSSFVVDAEGPGSTDVRLHWTPYWTVRGDACVEKSPDGWTRIVTTRPGPVEVHASFSLGGMLDPDKKCAPAGVS